ncbi:hypothetical protein PITC_005470 [Penicillium italicum]|uniref:Uncharacterized protein n=1 Tax=Penicillium italicum TaxID=40296 RepID=A0A0A2LCD1_PENIT|nr:hypothetical protein PITC_005470 [Penicillium italicum]
MPVGNCNIISPLGIPCQRRQCLAPRLGWSLAVSPPCHPKL